jgi:hypothetical protein
MQRLDSVSEIIDAAGGDTKFSRKFGFTRSQVSNWKLNNQFPARTYAALQPQFKIELNIDAPPSLWGQLELERSQS